MADVLAQTGAMTKPPPQHVDDDDNEDGFQDCSGDELTIAPPLSKLDAVPRSSFADLEVSLLWKQLTEKDASLEVLKKQISDGCFGAEALADEIRHHHEAEVRLLETAALEARAEVEALCQELEKSRSRAEAERQQREADLEEIHRLRSEVNSLREAKAREAEERERRVEEVSSSRDADRREALFKTALTEASAELGSLAEEAEAEASALRQAVEAARSASQKPFEPPAVAAAAAPAAGGLLKGQMEEKEDAARKPLVEQDEWQAWGDEVMAWWQRAVQQNAALRELPAATLADIGAPPPLPSAACSSSSRPPNSPTARPLPPLEAQPELDAETRSSAPSGASSPSSAKAAGRSRLEAPRFASSVLSEAEVRDEWRKALQTAIAAMRPVVIDWLAHLRCVVERIGGESHGNVRIETILHAAREMPQYHSLREKLKCATAWQDSEVDAFLEETIVEECELAQASMHYAAGGNREGYNHVGGHGDADPAVGTSFLMDCSRHSRHKARGDPNASPISAMKKWMKGVL
eukprot:TRINITY_DN12821_c0_g1_i1.p1 TRINITY_DN12821_c0_g1~~TRINITY_DN12821_c0_g1_i1.p1  ORF type:complete len:524 (+),score=168.33 TRINITY_DN12821_c0_g1_i1:123-1694(+)